MASFLVTCPQCRALIAKNMSCPDCRWSEAKPADAAPSSDMLQEYGRRESRHKWNYAVFMTVMLATGLVSLWTAIMWVRFIFLGSVVAFFWIGLLSVLSAGLGVALRCSKKLFPVDLNCPSCNVRLDQLGLTNKGCPACGTRLK